MNNAKLYGSMKRQRKILKESIGCEERCRWPGSQGGLPRQMRVPVYQRQDAWAVWGTVVRTESADADCIINSFMWNLTPINSEDNQKH